jgi:hypothetical protein
MDIVPQVYGGIRWGPRPGLDLDSGIRVRRDLVPPVPNTVVQAWVNGYGRPDGYLRSFVPTRPDLVYAIAEAYVQRFGPGWGITPRDPNTMIWPQNPGIRKDRG